MIIASVMVGFEPTPAANTLTIQVYTSITQSQALFQMHYLLDTNGARHISRTILHRSQPQFFGQVLSIHVRVGEL